jgi:hypothetical protein
MMPNIKLMKEKLERDLSSNSFTFFFVAGQLKFSIQKIGSIFFEI